MEIYLIRHGECYHSAFEFFDEEKCTMNPPLTEKGIRQAEKLAARCKDIEFDIVLSSDLSRAVQTAEKIAHVTSCDLTQTPAFREIDMGSIYTRSWNDYPELYAEWLSHNEDIRYPNGENGSDVWNRCRPQLDELVNKRYSKAAIVCHGGTIRSIVCGVLDIPQQKRFYFGLPPENCSITMIKYHEKEEKFYLHTFNDFCHLSDVV